MNDYSVKRRGTDVYGRPVLMTQFYYDWEQARWDNLGFSLPWAQGAFMSQLGGGAAASQGAHDLAGCVDYIIDDVPAAKAAAVVAEFRAHGGGAYRRGPDAKHGGMPTHLHNTLGADFPLAPMAQTLWNSYRTGGDGLAAGAGRPADARDYERRPNPLVLTPPEEDMALSDEDVQRIADAVWAKKVPTVDAPEGRYLSNVLAKLYNKTFPKKA